jgi:hypothetical protein
MQKVKASSAEIAVGALQVVNAKDKETKWAEFKRQQAEKFYDELEQHVHDKYISLEELEANYIPREKLFDEMERKYVEADTQACMERVRIQHLEDTARTRNRELQHLQEAEGENRLLRKEVVALQKVVATLRSQASGRKRPRRDAVPAVSKKSKLAS